MAYSSGAAPANPPRKPPLLLCFALFSYYYRLARADSDSDPVTVHSASDNLLSSVLLPLSFKVGAATFLKVYVMYELLLIPSCVYSL